MCVCVCVVVVVVVEEEKKVVVDQNGEKKRRKLSKRGQMRLFTGEKAQALPADSDRRDPRPVCDDSV